MVKCSCCAKKYSLKKLQRDYGVIDAFVGQKSALEAARELTISYQSVFDRYKKLRSFIVAHLQDSYDGQGVEEFEEYIFLYKRHKLSKDCFIGGYNFITLSRGSAVYNIPLPTLKRFVKDEDIAGVRRFVRNNPIAKVQSYKNTITSFWEFFEEFIKSFRGVHRDSFFLYLKEGEFRFNYTKAEQKKILEDLWIESIV